MMSTKHADSSESRLVFQLLLLLFMFLSSSCSSRSWPTTFKPLLGLGLGLELWGQSPPAQEILNCAMTCASCSTTGPTAAEVRVRGTSTSGFTMSQTRKQLLVRGHWSCIRPHPPPSAPLCTASFPEPRTPWLATP